MADNLLLATAQGCRLWSVVSQSAHEWASHGLSAY